MRGFTKHPLKRFFRVPGRNVDGLKVDFFYNVWPQLDWIYNDQITILASDELTHFEPILIKHVSNEKGDPGCLLLPSYVGIVINHDKDPRIPIKQPVYWKVRVFFSWLM